MMDETASNSSNNNNYSKGLGSESNYDYPFPKLPPLPDEIPVVHPLTKEEKKELESVFEFTATNDRWKDDWTGNLAFCEKNIVNPSLHAEAVTRNSFRRPLLLWAENSPDSVRLLRNLLRYVCTMEKVPLSAKKILGRAVVTTDKRKALDVDEVIALVHRASYDPQVLREDGWTVEKSASPLGAIGGPYLIGDKIRYEQSDAVVIAYVHDPDIGDLWKALWLEEQISFDMEAEELLEAKQKYERRYERTGSIADSRGSNKSSSNSNKPRRATRYGAINDFTVNGIEYGIVLCASLSKNARQGVYWPARVMHASEAGEEAAQARRSNITKQKLDVVFLAPYWSADELISARSRSAQSFFDNADSLIDSDSLLLVETIDASEEMIKEYPYVNNNELDLEQIRTSFRFTGLPKAALTRYLDSHRLAMSLLIYAKRILEARYSEADKATAGLFEIHPMALQTPSFPSVVLHLPFDYILSQLPRSFDDSLKESENGIEPVIKLDEIVDTMKPPTCWGIKKTYQTPVSASNVNLNKENSSEWFRYCSLKDDSTFMSPDEIRGFMTDYPYLNDSFNRFHTSPPLIGVLSSLTRLLAQVAEEEEAIENEMTIETRRSKLHCLVKSWLIVKRFGEESLALLLFENPAPVLAEWRRCCEKIYKFIVAMFSDGAEIGVGISIVITDLRCNEHRTSNGFERPVRLPAALKGAKLAGAGTEPQFHLLTAVPDKYTILAETKFLEKAHGAPYLKRMKSRCASGRTDKEIVALTEDSDGDGGDDTQGSKGTWNAAVVGVGAALAAADMIVQGECVNAFCATRPPGHHAGRSLHPMKAISNGFCILNPVACAAIYAASPIADGGLGLSRVCVLDFDVHHGNGTQDILCSTYDPRFLYISLHAGGAKINGHPMEDDPNHELHDLNSTSAGIYPGRCGDTSPHKGVLNIPLGEKVTSHAVGTALISLVSPRMKSFSPDLIILSAGFDAHKSDPMGLGDLRAGDFGHITQVVCQLASKLCSGRVLSVLEGGYAVPCCRPQEDLFLPKPVMKKSAVSRSKERKPTYVTSGRAEVGTVVKKPSDGKTPAHILEIDLESGKIIRKHVSVLKAAQHVKCSRKVIYNVLNGLKPGWNGVSWRYQKADEPQEAEVADESSEDVVMSPPEIFPSTKSETNNNSMLSSTHTISTVNKESNSFTAKKNGDKHTNDGNGTTPMEICTEEKAEFSQQDFNSNLSDMNKQAASLTKDIRNRPQPSKLLDLGTDLPTDMDDQVPYALQVRLEKCHVEGFVECVHEHVKSLFYGSKLIRR